MASTIDYLEYILDLLKEVEFITYKKMMGEYLLYQEGTLFGGIYDNRFLIKKTKSNASYNFEEDIPYDGAKPMYLVDIEDSSLLKEIILTTVNDLRK